MWDNFIAWLGDHFGDNLVLFAQALEACIEGVPLTLLLMVLSVIFGLILSVILTSLLQRSKGVLRGLIKGFVFFFTGSPYLIQLFIFYYGLPNWDVIGNLMQQPGFGFLKDPFIWVVSSLTLNTAAYTTVIFDGYIRNIDRGEIEAAKAYGMSSGQIFWRVTMPSAFRKALPAYSNEIIAVLQATALASAVTVHEITGQATDFIQMYYPPEYIGYGAAAIVYLILNSLFLLLFRFIEKRYTAHMRHAH